LPPLDLLGKKNERDIPYPQDSNLSIIRSRTRLGFGAFSTLTPIEGKKSGISYQSINEYESNHFKNINLRHTNA